MTAGPPAAVLTEGRLLYTWAHVKAASQTGMERLANSAVKAAAASRPTRPVLLPHTLTALTAAVYCKEWCYTTSSSLRCLPEAVHYSNPGLSW